MAAKPEEPEAPDAPRLAGRLAHGYEGSQARLQKEEAPQCRRGTEESGAIFRAEVSSTATNPAPLAKRRDCKRFRTVPQPSTKPCCIEGAGSQPMSITRTQFFTCKPAWPRADRGPGLKLPQQRG